ncbi:Rrf2 family transcriptional regulator [Polaribacter pectinis]|uniref:Rrf2 family transcriptional regulator n=1 Tax=Polaribacter pectinis TaxID=2738844 RepID=A0A7G9LCV2_9FLAO|nr:Rrf2 family transcriptional regulator [Polaribacter pectinis]QNM86451.1 Rrf2 family transcriptional regulator [Polaribacter pectinis]
MLSKASKYAISAVLYLTNTASISNKISSKEVAEKLNIPAPFLAKVIQELTKKGIVSSVKGPNGGFYLSEINEKNTIYDIIECIDDIDKFNQCYLGQHECNEENPCVVHYLYAPFKEKLVKKLKTKTILEMAIEYSKNNNLSEIIK